MKTPVYCHLCRCNLQITSSIRLVFSEVTYGMVILVDRLVYEVMDMINRHARITFKQEGTVFPQAYTDKTSIFKSLSTCIWHSGN